MTSEPYVPNEQEIIEGSFVSEDEARRGIARIKADSLRDAADNVRASSFWADGSDNYADRVRGYLKSKADRIEEEA